MIRKSIKSNKAEKVEQYHSDDGCLVGITMSIFPDKHNFIWFTGQYNDGKPVICNRPYDTRYDMMLDVSRILF